MIEIIEGRRKERQKRETERHKMQSKERKKKQNEKNKGVMDDRKYERIKGKKVRKNQIKNK